MIRTLLFLLVAALVVAAAAWFAAEPGRVAVDFRGWRVETSVGLLALAVALLALVAVAVYAALSGLLRVPRRFAAWRAERRRAGGLKALAAGMVAVAAGDARAARRAAARAEAVSGETPLTLLLAAQAAQLEGDAHAAERYFTAMLGRPETEFLGLRGLLVQALRGHDDARALTYAQRAVRLRPDAAWAQAALFQLAVRARSWGESEAALARAIRRGAIPRERGRRHRAALLILQSLDAERRDFPVEAAKLAARAVRAAPGFVPAALRRGEIEHARGEDRRARRALERAFAAAPHPELARAYLALAEGDGEEAALERVRLAERLLARAAGSAVGEMAVAEAALAARLWGKARGHLDRAEARFAEGPGRAPAGLYRLRARVEEDERGDAQAAARWLMKAGEAAPDPRWLCGACGAQSPAWTALCPACQGFDTIEWRSPEGTAVLGIEGDALAEITGRPDVAPSLAPPAAGALPRD